ncbi:hypothetical protein Taro_037263 [Colocasia esculenta]|uniref:SBP-type domain-containing protein n=1 Tax=Colocasia esculenta TaxID=4460 RepID=A0A843W3P4_COLES|nr:hypothetical protein [Colocasia esculenta]
MCASGHGSPSFSPRFAAATAAAAGEEGEAEKGRFLWQIGSARADAAAAAAAALRVLKLPFFSPEAGGFPHSLIRVLFHWGWGSGTRTILPIPIPSWLSRLHASGEVDTPDGRPILLPATLRSPLVSPHLLDGLKRRSKKGGKGGEKGDLLSGVPSKLLWFPLFLPFESGPRLPHTLFGFSRAFMLRDLACGGCGGSSRITRHRQAMDWNVKTPSQLDWESLAPFSVKAGDALKQGQASEWGGIENGPMYLSAGRGCSGSEVGYGSSSKSSISASIDSAQRAVPRVPVIDFGAVSKDPNYRKELARVEDSGTSPELTGSVGSAEPLIGLKLGKRTYFEDVCNANAAKAASLPAAPVPSNASVKKSRVSHQTVQNTRCQVEGCNVDLSTAKDYHRKHRVCENHSKCSKVIVTGQERRFCQQCSRFHDLSEFDQKKRSCRRRLSDHNARRRKPPPGTISFNATRFSSSFYDDRQQMNLLLNRSQFGHMRSANSTWESSCDFKLTQAKGPWTSSNKTGGIGGQLYLPSNELSTTASPFRHDLDRLLPFKGTTAEVLNQGLEASVIASNLDGAPDLRRALSLLSTDSWGSSDPGTTSSINQLTHVNSTSAAQSAMHVMHPSSDYWQAEQPLAQETRVFPFALHSNGSQFQEFQLLKTPYETAFFDSNQIH